MINKSSLQVQMPL